MIKVRILCYFFLICIKVRPLLFAAASADGFVYLYDIDASSSAPVATLDASSSILSAGRKGTVTRVAFTGVMFNHIQRDLIAACDSDGKVYVWRLGWQLANKHPKEQEELDKLGNVGQHII